MSLLLWVLVVAGGLVLLGIAVRRRDAEDTGREGPGRETHARPRRRGGGCH